MEEARHSAEAVLIPYKDHKAPVQRVLSDQIVSVSQPFVCPIVRGKAGKPVELGAKLDISVIDRWIRLEFRSFDAYDGGLETCCDHNGSQVCQLSGSPN